MDTFNYLSVVSDFVNEVLIQLNYLPPKHWCRGSGSLTRGVPIGRDVTDAEADGSDEARNDADEGRGCARISG